MILLLDDDRDFRDGVAQNLRKCGHQVTELESPDQLGQLEDLCGISAIVFDSGVRGCDGLGLVDRFHARYPEAPVIIATSCRDVAAHPGVHSRDYLYCFCKPLTSSALSRVVEVLLPSADQAA